MVNSFSIGVKLLKLVPVDNCLYFLVDIRFSDNTLYVKTPSVTGGVRRLNEAMVTYSL